jgi:hypothetical protein
MGSYFLFFIFLYYCFVPCISRLIYFGFYSVLKLFMLLTVFRSEKFSSVFLPLISACDE